jgi:very-short-patch-repair endonuclease
MPGVTTRARTLRNAPTRHEAILWARLKRFRADGFHFRRQAPLLGYYADFACLKHRLIVELDGLQHSEGRRREHDRTRDEAMDRAGFLVLRYPNARVVADIEGVLEEIWNWLQRRPARWGGD